MKRFSNLPVPRIPSLNQMSHCNEAWQKPLVRGGSNEWQTCTVRRIPSETPPSELSFGSPSAKCSESWIDTKRMLSLNIPVRNAVCICVVRGDIWCEAKVGIPAVNLIASASSYSASYSPRSRSPAAIQFLLRLCSVHGPCPHSIKPSSRATVAPTNTGELTVCDLHAIIASP